MAHKKVITLMPHSSAAELFNPNNPQFTAARFTLLAQIRSEAPVTFLPALNVYAVTPWQEVYDVLGDATTFASSEAFSAGVHLAPEASAIYSLTSPIVFFAEHETTINTIANALHSLLNRRAETERLIPHY